MKLTVYLFLLLCVKQAVINAVNLSPAQSTSLLACLPLAKEPFLLFAEDPLDDLTG